MDFINLTPAHRALATTDEMIAALGSSVKKHWDDAYPQKPIEVPGAEILDENNQSYDPARFEPATMAMVPDMEASQAFFDLIGPAGFALTAVHAILGNGANLKHIFLSESVPQSVLEAGIALAGAAVAFREACKAQGPEYLNALPVKVQPPFTLNVNPATGQVTVSPLEE
jgi:hypothetical protein